jgi:hypothetical protein
MSTNKEREPDFLSALAWIDIHYGTKTAPDDSEWDDPSERKAHIAHARSLGWKPPTGTS